ncbi:unnamed protein product, partial [Brachionus calyciflorus]
MKEAVELLSIIASAIFGKQYETSKTREESPDIWFDFYINLMENTWNKYQMLITTMSLLMHLDHETRRIIEKNQFSLHEETAYKELNTLLIQLYGKKATSNLELKRQFTEQVQNHNENVHLYASQLKVLAKQSHPELLQYQKDDLIKEQFIRGLRDKMLRTRLQMMREESSLEDIIDEAARYEKAVSD